MNPLIKKDFTAGMRAGIPVCVGYFSVSFGFGAMAVSMGLNIFQAVLISATNLTSAGQFAGLTVIATGGAIIEMILTQIVINSRYALMGLALSQKLSPTAGNGKRLCAAFFDTDEVFAIGMSQPGRLSTAFFVGTGVISAIGWISGTALGAIAGSLLPLSVRLALGALLYGMFIAIVIPQARQEKSMHVCMGIALVLSCMFTWLPWLKSISSGLAIVLCTVITAAICAVVFPIEEDEK